MGLAGGKEKTDQTPSFVRAVAKVERSVVIAAVISRPYFAVTYTVLKDLWFFPLKNYRGDKAMD